LIKKSPRLCSLGLNPPKEEGGGDNFGKDRKLLKASMEELIECLGTTGKH
jgi:hypothetical protein